MGTLTFLKFYSLNEFQKVEALLKRGWKIKQAGEEDDGSPVYALYINDGDEKDLHELYCPDCICWAIEVHTLDHEFLTCPGCGSEIRTEDWITEERFQEMFKDENDVGA